MTEKYIIFSLDDERAKKFGEAISNKTCKKIVNFLAEREASASEISRELGMPLNSVDYNIKKLIAVGMIEKVKKFFWSVKGKRIESYRVVNKVIVISPKKTDVYSKLKGFVPVVVLSAILTMVVGMYYNTSNSVQNLAEFSAKEAVMTAAPESADLVVGSVQSSGIVSYISYFSPWAWFAIGAGLAIVTFAIWNWKKL